MWKHCDPPTLHFRNLPTTTTHISYPSISSSQCIPIHHVWQHLFPLCNAPDPDPDALPADSMVRVPLPWRRSRNHCPSYCMRFLALKCGKHGDSSGKITIAKHGETMKAHQDCNCRSQHATMAAANTRCLYLVLSPKPLAASLKEIAGLWLM